MKANIEKLLNEIGNDRHGLCDLIVHYGRLVEFQMQEWWNAPLEKLRNNLRNYVKAEEKKKLFL